MRQLATQLAVGFDPTLLKPTELGVSHSPNSSFSRDERGVRHKRYGPRKFGAPAVCLRIVRLHERRLLIVLNAIEVGSVLAVVARTAEVHEAGERSK